MARRRSRRDFWHKQFFVLSVDLFKVDVGVAVNMSTGETVHALAKICSKKPLLDEAYAEMAGWDEDTGHQIHGRMCKMGGGFVVLLRFEKDEFRRAVAILTHEMVHVSQYLLRARRIPLSEDTEEVHAYLTEYLVEAALRKLYP